MKKVLSWGGLALLVFFIVTRPTEAAGVTRSLGNGLKDIATGISDFMTNLV